MSNTPCPWVCRRRRSRCKRSNGNDYVTSKKGFLCRPKLDSATHLGPLRCFYSPSQLTKQPPLCHYTMNIGQKQFSSDLIRESSTTINQRSFYGCLESISSFHRQYPLEVTIVTFGKTDPEVYITSALCNRSIEVAFLSLFRTLTVLQKDHSMKLQLRSCPEMW